MNKTIIRNTAIVLSALMVVIAAGMCVAKCSGIGGSSLVVNSLRIGYRMMLVVFFSVLCMTGKAGSRFFKTCVLLLSVESCLAALRFIEISSSQTIPSMVFLALAFTSGICAIIGFIRLAGIFSLKSQAGWASLAVCFLPSLISLLVIILGKTVLSNLATGNVLAVIPHIFNACLYIWFFLTVATHKGVAAE